MSKIQYSIVVPVYQSVSTLQPLCEGILKTLSKLNKTVELIFVEDSGSEASWNELLRLKAMHPEQVLIIRLSRNYGQNGATLCGIDQAKGEKIITIDDDLQTPPSQIAVLIGQHEKSGLDVVYGQSEKTQNSWFKKIGGKFIKKIFSQSQGGSSVGSSFRLIDGHIADKLRFHSQDHLFINQVITWYTLNYGFVEVEHQARLQGKSGYSLKSLIFISFRLIFYYTSIPLKIVIFLCALMAITSVVAGVLMIQAYDGLPEDLRAAILGAFISVGLILASISVLGVYLNRIYSSRVKKPNYAIKIKL